MILFGFHNSIAVPNHFCLHLSLPLSLSFYIFYSFYLSPSVYVCLDDKHKNGLYANDIFETIDQHPKMGWNLYHEWCLFVYFFVETLLFHLRPKVFINLQVVRFNSIIFPENANQNGQHCVLLRFQIIIHLNNLLFSLVGWRIWIWEEKKKHT